ncbi:hypothetical protein [Paenibacillus cineris]|uniref:Uncharacterized protein n=1 Tax=Paenibacillus cineris TaxID=237530 RepID=A0ABQ4LKW8_9BACL|nr:hypothetical protein [Paenibacillus cineris]GIO56895.1 hypothetical protein J21TS7_52130 [Paenibacillus cineris]
MKKVYSLVVCLMLLFTAVGSASAADFDNNPATGVYQGNIDLNNTSNDTVISESLTFDEMAQKISDDFNISIDEATKLLSQNSVKTLNATTASYRTITSSLDKMNNAYQPSMEFYCQTTEGGGYIAIEKIITWDLNRNDISGNGSKKFEGNIKTYLENGQSIHWILNGDFYNYGDGTLNVGGSIKLGETGTLTLTLTVKTGHYAYSYNSKDIWVGPR